jgi:DNA-binding GntR family transcriptional regulator
MTTQTLADKAYDCLETMIVTLVLQPGQVVSEAELCQQIGIGRTPLREAVQRLAGERLLNILPRRGVMVSTVNLTDQLALLETRRVLDRLVAQKAARHATADQRDALKTNADAIQAAATSGNISEFMQLDHACDLILEQAARNPYASRASAPLHTHCRRFWYLYKNNGDLSESAQYHADLMYAVARADEHAAADASDQLITYLMAFTRIPIESY